MKRKRRYENFDKTGYRHEGVDRDCGREGDRSGGGAMTLRFQFCVR